MVVDGHQQEVLAVHVLRGKALLSPVCAASQPELKAGKLQANVEEEEGLLPLQVVVDGHQQEALAEDVHVLRSRLMVSPIRAASKQKQCAAGNN